MEPNVFYQTQAGPYWDWKVAVDLFFGGAGVGAFLLAVGLSFVLTRGNRRVCQTAAWLAPILVVLGLLFLLLKLGRPHYLLLTFTKFVPTSPLWWGGIFQTLFVIGSIWYALRWRNPDSGERGTRILGLALTPVAVIVGAYHGLLLAVINARPVWNTGPTVVAAILGFATTGIAAVLITHLVRARLAGRLADPERVADWLDRISPVRNILVGAMVLQGGTMFFWWLSLRFGSLQDMQALEAANAEYGTMFWWLGVVLGLAVPLGLGALAVVRGERAHHRLRVQTIALTSALILIGGFFFRLAVVLGGQADTPIPTLS